MPHKYLRGPTGHLRIFIAAIFEMIDLHRDPNKVGFTPPWPYLCASANQARNLRAEFYRYRARLRKAGTPNEDLEQIIIRQQGEHLMITHMEFDPEYAGSLGAWDTSLMSQVNQKVKEMKTNWKKAHMKRVKP